jgi:hypothetical protein
MIGFVLRGITVNKIGLPGMIVILITLVLVGCAGAPPMSQTPAGGGAVPTASQTRESTATPLTESELPGGALSAKQVLAEQLHVDVDTVSVISVEKVEWPDACLGVTPAGTMCAQVITSGYRIGLEAQGQRYEYHTDLNGGRVVLAAAPEPDIKDAAIIWAQQYEGQCEKAVIGSDTVAFGPCQGDLMAGRYASEARQADYGYFTSTFAPFEAEPPAGRVVFQGQGHQQATPSQQRMIAEWARLVAQEASTGHSDPTAGMVLAWHRGGGIAGFCDDLNVYLSGDVYASSCKGNDPKTLTHVRLGPDDLERLYDWVDRLDTWNWQQSDDAKADAMTISMFFSGWGIETPSDEDKQDIQAWAAQLFTTLSQRQ